MELCAAVLSYAVILSYAVVSALSGVVGSNPIFGWDFFEFPVDSIITSFHLVCVYHSHILLIWVIGWSHHT